MTVKIINIIIRVSKSKEGTRADMYQLLRTQRKRNSKKDKAMTLNILSIKEIMATMKLETTFI